MALHKAIFAPLLHLMNHQESLGGNARLGKGKPRKSQHNITALSRPTAACCTHEMTFGKAPPLAWMIPTMTPKRPRALPKISTMSIFTKSSGLWASPRAQPLPETPTQIPQKRLESPTERPTAKRQYPEAMTCACQPFGWEGTTNSVDPSIL